MKNDNLEFIVKTSFNCNMRCAYCYEGHTPNMGFMDKATVNTLIAKSAEHSIKTGAFVNFTWHGGEPLLVGKKFYEDVVATQKSFGPEFRYKNSIQTNGLLLDGAFADFFIKNHFGVGVSIDGPPIIHDAQRFLKAPNAASFKQVYAALVEMDNRDMRAGALAIFTRNTLDHIDEFYDFFRDRSLNVKMNPLVVAGNAKDAPAKYLQVTPKEYGEALVYLFDRWIGEPAGSFSIDTFSNITRSLVSGDIYSCSQAGQCFNYFKVFPNGNIHMCGKMPYDKHLLGNINKDNLVTILNSPERKRYALEKEALKEVCKPCGHFDICHGGCTQSAYARRQQTTDKQYYCESFNALFNRMKAVVPKHIALCKQPSAEAIHCG